MQDVFTQTLTDTDLNLNIPSFITDATRCTPACPVPWSFRKFTLHGGRQEGVDLIEINNGRLTLRVIPTRGMNILDATMGSIRLGWDSPIKEVVHPTFIQPHNRGGLGWLEGFNEYLCRCGLEWFGSPTTDNHHHAAGEAPANNLTLHGKISNIPASRVQFMVETQPPYRITVRGLVRERSLFGPKFDMTTSITTTPGSNLFTVTDTIANQSAGTQEFSLLYHINHGRPLLEKGSRFVAPVRRVIPMTRRAIEGGVRNYDKYGPPQYGYTEQNYLVELIGDRHGQTTVMLRNRAGNRAVTMSFNLKQLPCFTIWKNTQHELDGYVTGLEPGTSYPFPRPAERKAGRIPTLGSGDSYQATISFALLDTRKGINATTRAIQSIQGKAKIEYVDSIPT